MRECPKCNQVFLDEYQYCLTDGSKLENVMDINLIIEDFSSAPTEVIPARQIISNDLPKSQLTNQFRENVSPLNKNKRWLYLLSGILTITAIAIGYLLYKPTVSEMPKIVLNPSGRWKGEWSSPNGNLYQADVNLNDEEVNKLSGQIVYTLKESKTRAKDKIGSMAIEHVEGTFDPMTRLLQVRGVKKDDPQNIIILDKYQLTLSEDNQTLIGNSLNGRLILKR